MNESSEIPGPVGSFSAKVKEIEKERVFGSPGEAAKQAREVQSEIVQSLSSLRDLNEEEKEKEKIFHENLALSYVDAAFKELSSLNSFAQDTPEFDAKQKILDEARARIRDEKEFHVLALRLGKDVEGKPRDWSQTKLREFGRMYERHENEESWKLAKLCYKKVCDVAEEKNDLPTLATATMELARVCEKLGEPDIDQLFQKAEKLNWQARGDGDVNRFITVEGYLMRKYKAKKDYKSFAKGAVKILWVANNDISQFKVLGKKLLDR